MSSRTSPASAAYRTGCSSSNRLISRSSCWHAATLGRQPSHRLGPLPRSMVVPSRPITTHLRGISKNINHIRLNTSHGYRNRERWTPPRVHRVQFQSLSESGPLPPALASPLLYLHAAFTRGRKRMANAALFRSLIAALIPKTDVHNDAGGRAYELPP